MKKEAFNTTASFFSDLPSAISGLKRSKPFQPFLGYLGFR